MRGSGVTARARRLGSADDPAQVVERCGDHAHAKRQPQQSAGRSLRAFGAMSFKSKSHVRLTFPRPPNTPAFIALFAFLRQSPLQRRGAVSAYRPKTSHSVGL